MQLRWTLEAARLLIRASRGRERLVTLAADYLCLPEEIRRHWSS